MKRLVIIVYLNDICDIAGTCLYFYTSSCEHFYMVSFIHFAALWEPVTIFTVLGVKLTVMLITACFAKVTAWWCYFLIAIFDSYLTHKHCFL